MKCEMMHMMCAWLKDVVFREPKLVLRYYRPFCFKKSAEKEATNVLMVDDHVQHGGMFDCLKGIITIYAISKACLLYTSPSPRD